MGEDHEIDRPDIGLSDPDGAEVTTGEPNVEGGEPTRHVEPPAPREQPDTDDKPSDA